MAVKDTAAHDDAVHVTQNGVWQYQPRKKLGYMLAERRQRVLQAHTLVVHLPKALRRRWNYSVDFPGFVPGLHCAIEIIVDVGAVYRLGPAAYLQFELPRHATEDAHQLRVYIFAADEELVRAEHVLEALVLGDSLLERLQRLEQTHFIDERQNSHTQPRHLLAIHIHLERLGIEINNGRLRVDHELLVVLRQRVLGKRRQTRHELLERLKRLCVFREGDIKIA
mmetsp:Transcript_3924/g.5700  ORF Transcript_3924/g.5700 Transcript_3924/m.5700 type:complete len:224 (-) Transcript_3924:502-1173(-)